MSEHSSPTLDPEGQPFSPHTLEGLAGIPTDVVAFISNAAITGKTTLAVNLAATLAKRGMKVLVVDLDRGRFATDWLRPIGNAPLPTIADTLVNHVPIRDVIRGTAVANVDVVAGSPALGRVEEIIGNAPGWETTLSRALEASVGDYQYIFIDCPPNLRRLSICALMAAHSFIIPVVPHLSSPAEINDEMKSIAVEWEDCETRAKLLGIVLNQVDKSRSQHTLVRVTNFRAGFKNKVFRTLMLGDTALCDCQQRRVTICDHAPNGDSVFRFNHLAIELFQRTRGYAMPLSVPPPDPPPNPMSKWKETPSIEPPPTLPRSMMKSDLDTDALAAQSLGLALVNLSEVKVTPELLAQIPAEQMRQWSVFPVRFTETEIHVALADPFDSSAVEKLQELTGKKVIACFDANGRVDRMIRHHCG